MTSVKKSKEAHKKLGQKGEKWAAAELKKLGLDVLMMNYSVHNTGEIDIIARDGSCLCFIEVKTRKFSWNSTPSEAVTSDKKLRLWKTAKNYLNKIHCPEMLFRFDTVEIVVDKNYRFKSFNHIPNSFNEEDIIKIRSAFAKR